MRYEYIRIEFDIGDLQPLNIFSSNGWKVIALVPDPTIRQGESSRTYALLERPLPGGYNFKP